MRYEVVRVNGTGWVVFKVETTERGEKGEAVNAFKRKELADAYAFYLNQAYSAWSNHQQYTAEREPKPASYWEGMAVAFDLAAAKTHALA